MSDSAAAVAARIPDAARSRADFARGFKRPGMSRLPMDRSQWPRVREQFLAAIELPPGERAGFLERSEPDEAVRAHVIALLEADTDPATILSGSAEDVLRAGSAGDILGSGSPADPESPPRTVSDAPTARTMHPAA